MVWEDTTQVVTNGVYLQARLPLNNYRSCDNLFQQVTLQVSHHREYRVGRSW